MDQPKNNARLREAVDHCCLMGFNILMVGGAVPLSALLVGSVALLCFLLYFSLLWARGWLSALLFSKCGEIFGDWADSLDGDLTNTRELSEEVFSAYRDVMQPCVLVSLDKCVPPLSWTVWVLAGFLSCWVGLFICLCLLPFILVARVVRNNTAVCED